MSTVELERVLMAAIKDIPRDCTKCRHNHNYDDNCEGYRPVFEEQQLRCSDWEWRGNILIKESKP